MIIGMNNEFGNYSDDENVKISYGQFQGFLMKKWIIPLILIIASIVFMIVSFYASPLECSNEEGQCYTTTISRVIDGDTIKTIEDDLIGFALSTAPELHDDGGQESKEYLESLCPVGSHITIDEDSGQLTGSNGSTIAKVYCNGLNLNGEMVINDHATIDIRYCKNSEFAQESWASQCHE